MPSRSYAVVAVAALLALVPNAASAGSDKELPAVGEDDALYSCKDVTGPIAITFKPETDVKELVTWAMSFTCKSYTYDPRIVANGRKVTVIVPKTIDAAGAYRIFLGALAQIGLAVVPRGNSLTIIDSHVASKAAVPMATRGTPDDSDAYVRYVIRPEYASGDTLAQAFNALKSDVGDVQLVGSLLLVNDYASHVREMLSLSALIDVPGGTEGIYTIPVVHADAAKLADKIGSILGLAAAAPPSAPGAHKPAEPAPVTPSKIVVDDRTNTLIVAASDAGYKRVKALVERLDIALEVEGGATYHVYQLGNAIADELAKTLNDAIQGQRGATPAATGGAAGPRPSQPVAPDALAIESPARVISDAPTNSLIVMSSGRDFFAIKDMIKQLDQPRRQVFIETMIVEVSMINTSQLGFSGHITTPADNGQSIGFGAIQSPELSSLNLATLTGANGLIEGLIGPQILNSKDILGQSIPSYGLLFQALATDSRTNVMSAPSMIALDNAETKYKVGTNIPYKKGVLPTSATTPLTQVTTNIERQPLVLELDIKPHISSDNSVMLEIKHESQDLQSNSDDLGPTWTTRSFETRVVVRDQQTVFLGGLMQDRDDTTVSKVPILGDVPILGALFKYTTKIKKKTNLVIILTPYVIKDQHDLERILARKQRQQDEFVGSVAALDHVHYQEGIDYRLKRGVVEEINRTLQAADEDAAARAALHKSIPVEEGLVTTPPGGTKP